MPWRGVAARRQAGSPEVDPATGFRPRQRASDADRIPAGNKRPDGNGSVKPNGLGHASGSLWRRRPGALTRLREPVARLALAAGERKAASRSVLLSEKDLRTRTER